MTKAEKMLIEEIEQLKLNNSDNSYQKVLKKVLRSNNAEIIYIFAKEIANAPIEILAQKIMEKDVDYLKDIKKNTWRVKFAKDFGSIDLNLLWCYERNIYKNMATLESLIDFDYEKLKNDLLSFATIIGAPVDEIYNYLKWNDGISSNLMQEFLNLGVELNLNEVINQFEELNVYEGDNPKDIYDFVYNYRGKISIEQMDQIISILFKKLQEYYYIPDIDHKFSHVESALDTLVLFLTNIKNLTRRQQKMLVYKSLKKVNYDILRNEEYARVIEEYESMKRCAEMETDNYVQRLRYSMPFKNN